MPDRSRTNGVPNVPHVTMTPFLALMARSRAMVDAEFDLYTIPDARLLSIMIFATSDSTTTCKLGCAPSLSLGCRYACAASDLFPSGDTYRIARCAPLQLCRSLKSTTSSQSPLALRAARKSSSTLGTRYGPLDTEIGPSCPCRSPAPLPSWYVSSWND